MVVGSGGDGGGHSNECGGGCGVRRGVGGDVGGVSGGGGGGYSPHLLRRSALFGHQLPLARRHREGNHWQVKRNNLSTVKTRYTRYQYPS